QVLVRDHAAWEALWSDMGREGAAPKVNFDQQMIAGVFLGEKPTDGYRVNVTPPVVNVQEAVISYSVTTPSSGTATTAGMTQPYHLRTVPRTDKPVRFTQD